jgi:hypothetical protein
MKQEYKIISYTHYKMSFPTDKSGNMMEKTGYKS